MKKYFGFIMIAGLLFSSSIALAEDGNSGNKDGDNSGKSEVRARVKASQENFRMGLQSSRAAFLAEVKLRTDEFKTGNEDQRREFWGKAKDMISQRFEITINTIANVQVRVGDLIVSLNAEGKDTEAASDYLDSSKSELADAKAKVADIKSLLPTDGSKVTPEIFAQIKIDARDAKDLLKESRNNLFQAIKEIKGLRDDNKKEESN